MIQLHNMTARAEQKNTSASLPGSGNCVELEGLTKTRGEAFTDILVPGTICLCALNPRLPATLRQSKRSRRHTGNSG